MQCSSCFSDKLSPTDDGILVCGDCGEQIVGFQEEELDTVLTGTAVSNRQSQSSQARATRETIQFRQAHPVQKVEKHASDDILLCEGAFIVAKAFARRLIQLKYCNERIMPPLFEIISCWVRRRHAGAQKLGKSHKSFQQYHILSLICLASLYVRSPMLPRDLCRLVATRQIPYFAVLKKIFAPEFHRSKRVRSTFTPSKLPIAQHVARVANELANDKYSWPPLRRYFLGHVTAWSKISTSGAWGTKCTLLPSSFPVGHLHITLLRLCRLLGLPDNFGARVLRFIELRLIAVKMARVLNHQQNGPWDDSRLDMYDIDHIPNYLDPSRPFSKVIRPERDLYSFPTDQSVQADFVNTMRLCYGRLRFRASSKCGKPSAKEKKYLEEWQKCKLSMLRWMKIGNPEDLNNVGWSGLSAHVIQNMGGMRLREYAELVNDIHGDLGEEDPEYWGKYVSNFKELGEQLNIVGGEVLDTSGDNQVVEEEECMYDIDRIAAGLSGEVTEWVGNMREESRLLDSLDLYDADIGATTRRSLRRWELKGVVRKREFGRNRRLDRKAVSCYEYYSEPAGIGMAWTILYRFFRGGNVILEGMNSGECGDVYCDEVRRSCDRTLGVVIRYILGVKGLREGVVVQ